MALRPVWIWIALGSSTRKSHRIAELEKMDGEEAPTVSTNERCGDDLTVWEITSARIPVRLDSHGDAAIAIVTLVPANLEPR